MRPLLLALALVSAGCFNVDEHPCSFACGPNGECPDDYLCLPDGYCHLHGTASVCAFSDAAMADANLEMSTADLAGGDGGGAIDLLPPADLTGPPADLTAPPPDLTAPPPDLTALPPDLTAPPSFSLTVSRSGVGGTVNSSPMGIACGATCSSMFPQGTMVMLTASATGFVNWTGGCSGTTNPCTLTISANTSVTANYTAALSFDGAGAATVADVAALDPTSALTVEGWFLLSSTAAAAGTHVAAVSKGDPFAAVSPTGYQLGYFNTAGTFNADFWAVVAGTVQGCQGSTGGAATLLHHLALTFDGTKVAGWVDGVQVCTAAAAGSLTPSATALSFGAPGVATATNIALTGTVDDARISNAAIYSATFTPARHPTAAAATVGLWPMDEGSGTTTNDKSTTAANASWSGTHVSWVPEP